MRNAQTVWCSAPTLWVIVGLTVPMTAVGHHGSAPHFDPDEPVTVEGTVSELRFVNPHAFLHFDVTGENNRRPTE